MSNHLQRFLGKLFFRAKTSPEISEDEQRIRTQSTGRLRDMKKRKNLRTKRDNRRESAPPEMNSRFLVTRRQGVYEVSPDLPIGARFVSPTRQISIKLPKDRDRLLVVTPISGFAERPVDCEPPTPPPRFIQPKIEGPKRLESSKSGSHIFVKNVENNGSKRGISKSPLRRNGTPHLQKKRARRPVSCGNLLERPNEIGEVSPINDPIYRAANFDIIKVTESNQKNQSEYMNLPLILGSPLNFGSLADRPTMRASVLPPASKNLDIMSSNINNATPRNGDSGQQKWSSKALRAKNEDDSTSITRNGVENRTDSGLYEDTENSSMHEYGTKSGSPSILSGRRPSHSLDSADNVTNPIDGIFRQDFVKGLWSMGQFRLHVNDAGTNTDIYESKVNNNDSHATYENETTSTATNHHMQYENTKVPILFNSLFDESMASPHASPGSSGSSASTDSGRDTEKQRGSPSSGQSISPSSCISSSKQPPLREVVEPGSPYTTVPRKKRSKPVPAPRRRSRSEANDEDTSSLGDVTNKSVSEVSLLSAVSLTSQWTATVAVDIGTAYCGYTAVYADSQKGTTMRIPCEERVPCCLLLSQDGNYHSFGAQAGEFYHNLDAQTSHKYNYFDNFKCNFNGEDFSEKAQITARNGNKYPASTIFAHCLRYFKRKFVEDHSNCGQPELDPNTIRWVISVPSNWNFPSRILLRHTAFQAGLVPSLNPDQVQVVSESDAAATFCANDHKIGISNDKTYENGASFMTVLCGAENVEITVFRSHLKNEMFYLKELQRTSAGAYGAHGIDIAFKGLLVQIFGHAFLADFIEKYPASWHCITKCFESVKRMAHPFHLAPFNLVLPSAFVEYYKKHRNQSVDKAVKKFGSQYIKWTQQEMLCFYPEALQQLFAPTILSIVQCVNKLVTQYTQKDCKNKLGKIYILGGFAQSSMLIHAMRLQFGHVAKVEVPLNPSGCISSGALLYYSTRCCTRIPRARYSYGVSVLHPFNKEAHPKSKCIERQGNQWCTDIFDRLIPLGQSLSHPKHRVIRSYCPAKGEQDQLVVQVYCSDQLENPRFVTDAGVKRIAVIKLELNRDEQKEINEQDDEFQLRFDLHGPSGGALTVSAINARTKTTIPCHLQPIVHK